MNLNDAQRTKVAGWIAEGLKLSEIQNRIASELDVRMTYMDVRLLVDDLKLVPKDAEIKPPPPVPTTPPSPTGPVESVAAVNAGGAAADAPKSVSLSVDQIARAGAIVSGKVTFTDGAKAEWYLDQSGRLGLAAQQAGYRPAAADLQQFQVALETELSKMGF
jgi:hypothetical protein